MKRQKLNNFYKKIHQDFIFFANKILKIRTKLQGLSNFVLNKEQLYIYNILKKQQQTTGRVKILILKGRQVGVTTLIAAKNYYFSLTNKGIKSLVLTHRQSATNNIYSMIKRFYMSSPFFLDSQLVLEKMWIII